MSGTGHDSDDHDPPALTDWSALPPAARAEAAAVCAGWAAEVQARFGAFSELQAIGAPDNPGPLAGLPYAAKDMFDTPGRPPGCGLPTALRPAPTGTATVLDRLDGAGARRIGFTTMTALAYEPSGVGTARNPWNRDFVTGGSSSGSAVAVAAGAVFVALGSDTAGSLRIPAQACGVTAWKPTHGAVPTAGAMPLAPSLDSVGLLARSARDIRLVEPLLRGTAPAPSPSPSRLAVLSDALAEAEAPVRAACAEGVEAVAACGPSIDKRAGLAAIEALSAPLFLVLQAEAAAVNRGLDLAAQEPTLARRLAKGDAIGPEQLAAARATLADALPSFLDTVFGGADAVLLPVMPIRTPPVAEADPTSPAFRAATLYRLSAYTRFVNALGLPAVAVPVGADDRGMPVALQIVGRPGTDAGLLDLAAAMQARTGWHRRRPTDLTDLPSPLFPSPLVERGT
ncbi:amidase [Azospirillum rugosum]|uniref:Aspartyl-tRNA(Asn)/glutamyl-tRNA(Gln) amidotransferase subunit A n=1 Tax=Azospirillum rugosum TaxID=416170 RepID=A0ABS4ST53_9PROT|nr:amidase [Azospirillum rugosum]MBP2295738.1 aspartyl-tRNA(Asn)/glutamyl-tRNA(Gln) amidotransferase subunit A [Azospirillum rugosum]MDQ0529151.1 aspartyl-tRNA(Asn)/glutamyl-tRNA(Gln) amidotransferase subunit A [Azospirillum rugosum]